jgi:hypothetical protein
MVPAVEKRVYLVKEFVDRPPFDADPDVPDPIGRGHAEYQDCLLTIKEAVERIEKLL